MQDPLYFFQDDQWIAHMLQHAINSYRVANIIRERNPFGRSYAKLETFMRRSRCQVILA